MTQILFLKFVATTFKLFCICTDRTKTGIFTLHCTFKCWSWYIHQTFQCEWSWCKKTSKLLPASLFIELQKFIIVSIAVVPDKHKQTKSQFLPIPLMCLECFLPKKTATHPCSSRPINLISQRQTHSNVCTCSKPKQEEISQ